MRKAKVWLTAHEFQVMAAVLFVFGGFVLFLGVLALGYLLVKGTIDGFDRADAAISTVENEFGRGGRGFRTDRLGLREGRGGCGCQGDRRRLDAYEWSGHCWVIVG